MLRIVVPDGRDISLAPINGDHLRDAVTRHCLRQKP
jgi:hypothetical protein